MMLTAAEKPAALLHDTGAGLPCTVCEDICPGLEIHYWRKICINCKCPVSDHQAPLISTSTTDPSKVQRGKQLDENVRAQFECGQFSWIPAGLPSDAVEEYMKQLPPEQRPLVGSVGEQFRRKLLMTQLPAHDHTPSESLTPGQATELEEFSRMRYDMSHGVGEVRPVTEQQAEMFDCRTCQSPLETGQLAVFAGRAGSACIWCVPCFKCDVCEEPLVDLNYFYKDGELFCGRHHAELLKPRCAACDELIFAKEYTLAEDRNWHIDHFCCWECDSPLGGQRYVTRDDHPFCILCYEEIYAPPCKKCTLPIGLDSGHMVHKDYHWHATSSCFFCESCQVSLITSPFLLKHEEIFCSSACAQEFSATLLSDDPPAKTPQIEIIEDSPVDKSKVHSILRKESSPSPPVSSNGTSPPKRKVMFEEGSAAVAAVERSRSEEEFEYLEQSLTEHHVREEVSAEYVKGMDEDDRVPFEKESSPPFSESSLSTSPLSDSEHPTSPFYTSPHQGTTEEKGSCSEEVPEDTVLEEVTDNLKLTREGAEAEEKEESSEESSEEDEEEEPTTPRRDDDEVDSDPIQVQQSETNAPVEIPEENELKAEEPVGDEEPTPFVVEERKEETVEEVRTEEKFRTEEEVRTMEEVSVRVEEVSVGVEEISVRVEETTAEDKENNVPENGASEDGVRPPPKKPARNKLSSASFNRVIRKIDSGHEGGSMYLDRPGKRLRSRPRSLSSLSTASRAQNTLEHKESLMNMFALAPDIADMVASVYQNNHSINTTTMSLPDRDERRTLGASPIAHSLTETPRAVHRRNPSYEAAELVMELAVESEEEEDGAAVGKEEGEKKPVTNVKHVTIDETANVTGSPLKTPKKGLKERLSFRKKKEKKSPSRPTAPSTSASASDQTGDVTSPERRAKKANCSVM